MPDDAARIVRFWQAVEKFSPQSLKDPDPRKNLVDVRPGEPMPWEPGSSLSQQPVKPGKVWRHRIYGGVYELSRVRDVLVRLFGDDQMEERQHEPVRGESALFACTIDEDGFLVAESAVLSMCPSAIGRAAASRGAVAAWLDGFDADVLSYEDELGKLAGSRLDAGVRWLAASIRAAVPGAVGDGVKVAVTGALAPVAGPLAAAGGTLAAGVATDLAKTAVGNPSAASSDNGKAQPLARLDLHALSGADLQRFTRELATRLRVQELLSPRNVRVHSFQVSTARADEEVGQSFLNSFYVDDLARVAKALDRGNVGKGLASYLTSGQRLESARRIDIRRDPSTVWAGCTPDQIPLGRWVSNTDHALAFSQQFAVNQIMAQLGGDCGLFAVNGPPGSGKTTMLRDLVAAVVVERAIRLAALGHPRKAFGTNEYTWQTERFTHKITSVAPALTGFEMTVASANNGAVENVTKEIPGPRWIGTQWCDAANDIGYFTDTARLVCGDGAWAMIAAVLGKQANRIAFAESFWWGRAAMASDAPMRASHGAQDGGMLKILKTLDGAPRDWPAAVKTFRCQVDRVKVLAAKRQRVAAAITRLSAGEQQLEQAAKDFSTATTRCAALLAQQPSLDARFGAADDRWQAAWAELEEHQRHKPGLLASVLTSRHASREWHETHRGLHDMYRDATQKRDVAEQRARNIQDSIADAMHTQNYLKAALQRLTRGIEILRRQIEEAHQRWGDHVPYGLEYTETMDLAQIEQREKSAVWADEEFTAARTELFMAALALHRAFVIAESSRIRGNLGALMDILGGKGRPKDRAAVLAAWQTFFLVVPVVSSTFASFDRLFAGLGREALGWLFIDEAGQASPQQAVGAIWRAQRTVVVGDPMQLEPVVTLPWGAQQAQLQEFHVPEEWAPSRTSAQQVADRTARYGTWLPADTADGSGHVWVGTPLRVHRRCDRPMFDISNQIAYDGLMVFGTAERDPFHGRNVWWDVGSQEARGHWIPAEGHALRKMLESLRQAEVPVSEIRIISPFRDVIEQAKSIHRDVFRDSGVLPDDRKKWVGTVHTMQGKEADVVILVLGGNPDRPGARRFAIETPNLLNVAVSRAKRRLVVIGDRQTWSAARYFTVLSAHLDPWPPREA